VLFNEPKLLKYAAEAVCVEQRAGFSALQRAEIAEIQKTRRCWRCSARFSALQRAEIAEIFRRVLLIKQFGGFSALQRAEIAEITRWHPVGAGFMAFQCSSTSRNC